MAAVQGNEQVQLRTGNREFLNGKKLHMGTERRKILPQRKNIQPDTNKRNTAKRIQRPNINSRGDKTQGMEANILQGIAAPAKIPTRFP